MRKAFFVIAIILIIVAGTTVMVSADSFAPTGDIDQCRFASTLAVQYDLPNNPAVDYDSEHIFGERSGWIESSYFHDVASISYPDAARFPGTADEVAVPPGTDVELGMFVWNYAGHDVNVKDLQLFTSKPNTDEGDLTRLGATGEYKTIHFNDNRSTRSGKALTIPVNKTYGHRQAYRGEVIYRFTTIQPISIENYTVQPRFSGSNLHLDYSLTLKNNSTYSVCGISIDDTYLAQNIFSQENTCINSGAEREVAYSYEVGKQYENNFSLEGVRVADNNFYQESNSSQYTGITDYYNFPARSLYINRDDEVEGWYGLQPGWGQVSRDLVTVKIIPYVINADRQSINLPEEVQVSKTVTDSDEKQVTDNEAKIGELLTFTVTTVNKGARQEGLLIEDMIDEKYFQLIETSVENIGSNAEIIVPLPTLEANEKHIFTYKVRVVGTNLQEQNEAVNKVSVSNDNVSATAETSTIILGGQVEDNTNNENTPVLYQTGDSLKRTSIVMSVSILTLFLLMLYLYQRI
jgi:hypothetical protein